MQLFLWKLSQSVNNDYSTYDSAIVVAHDRISASQVHPARYSDTGEPIYRWDQEHEAWFDVDVGYYSTDGTWCFPNEVEVVCIGKAADHLKEGDVVCSSYNAG